MMSNVYSPFLLVNQCYIFFFEELLPFVCGFLVGDEVVDF